MSQSLIDYIRINYWHLDTFEESDNREFDLMTRISKYFFTIKFLEEKENLNSIDLEIIKKNHELTDSEIELYKNVYQERIALLIEKKASKIYQEHREKMFFNQCPKCGRLARTPYAQQGRCGHSWRTPSGARMGTE